MIALLAGCTKGFFGKRISGRIRTQKQSVFVNAVRMAICVVISLLTLLPEFIAGNFIVDGEAWLFSAFAGIIISLFMVTWLLAVQKGAYMLISVAQMFGVVVTLVCSFLVFKTPIMLRQIIAMAILVVSVLVMGSYSAKIKGALSVGTIILLVICGLSSGLYDFSLKLFTYYSKSSVSTLNLFSYLIASVALFSVFILTEKGDGRDEVKSLLRVSWLPLLIMSACLFANSYFKALANNYLSPTQVYPIYQAGGLLLGGIMSAVFFKEKITLRCIIGMVLAGIAIILLK